MKFLYFVTILVLLSNIALNNKHFLMILLSLEFMMLILIFNFFLNYFSLCMFLTLCFMVLSACEGALGLSILVSLSRSYSSDYLMMFSFLN